MESFEMDKPVYKRKVLIISRLHIIILILQAVVIQPTTFSSASQNSGKKPNNFLAMSVINLLLCFLLLGIIALVFSCQVSYEYQCIVHTQ